MNKISLFIFLFFAVASVFAKFPHGEGFKMECANCHNTSNWELINSKIFNHNKTKFPLIGQHKTVECRKCHPTLVFDQAKTQCSDCHKDMHGMTVGIDCERCHTPKSWIVSNVRDIHQEAGFTLAGAHASIDCNLCHKSASLLRFENIKTDCYSCHKANYDATNHKSDGFGTDCFNCHNMTGQSWSILGKGFEHGLFPLTGGHSIACNLCHVTNEYRTILSPDCKGCHLALYNATTNPVHTLAGFSTDCQACHSINNWTSSTFNHSTYFPLKGNHNISCATCHTNPSNYKVFTCVTAACHQTAHNQNRGPSGCYSCHPNG